MVRLFEDGSAGRDDERPRDLPGGTLQRIEITVGKSQVALREVGSFGENPGALRMHVAVPSRLPRRPALVVVLHGCTQTAAGYDLGSGWSRLAVEQGFIVLYPEQRAVNNDQTCFSWFQPGDVTRGGGEVESIRQMIEAVSSTHDVDRDRVFVCGLSAGGAMAGAMLAAYPEIFAGGALLAGLPYGAASNVSEVFDAMFTGRIKDAATWGDAVRAASTFAGPWPSVAVWHGTSDRVVKPINSGEIVKQWTDVHGLGATVPSEDHVDKVARRVWSDATGRACVIDYTVPGMGHGAPVDDIDPPAPFFLPAGISSTRQIARDFGLVDVAPGRRLLARIGVGA